MKFLCDACERLVEIDVFAIRDGVLCLTCPRCLRDSRSPPAARVLPASPAEPAPAEAGHAAAPVPGLLRPPPTGSPAPVIDLAGARRRSEPPVPRCPKCGAPRDPARGDCTRCGLVFSLFRPELLELPEAVEQQWQRLVADWNEPGGHEAFLATCTAARLLPEAVRRYRLRADESPADALAARYRDDAIARLMALASLPAPQEPAAPKRLGILPILLFTITAVAALSLALWQFLPPGLFAP